MKSGCFAAFGLLAATALAAQPLPWETWTDLHRLPEVYEGHQSLLRSSHCPDGCRFDRHSADEPRFVYVDGDEGVIFEEEGAGAVTRIWMTMGDGTSVPLDPDIRILITVDGAARPVVDVPIPQLFDGSTAPFLPPLAGNRTVSSGGNFSYVPIPYRDGCRISLIGADDKKIWFQIGFHRLADATGVTSFTGDEDLTDFAALLALQAQDPWPPDSGTTVESSVTLSPGEEMTIAALAGPGSVTALHLGLEPALWSEIELSLRFDGETTARMTLADFFAIGKVGPLPTRSLLVGFGGDGFLYSYFPMPFFTSAELALHHAGASLGAKIDILVRVDSRPPSARSGLFGAELRHDDATPIGIDFPLLELSGHGKLAGLFLELGTISGTDRQYVEGDERFFIDGSAHPAVYGTGVEDIFNGGFGFHLGPFSLPLHGAPYTVLDDGGARFTAAYRLMLTDAVTFTHRLFAGLEAGPTGNISMRARATTYFYRRRPARLYLWDRLDLGDETDRELHQYQVAGPHTFEILEALFEGEPPAGATATGVYRSAGAATFVLRPHPTSTRFRLRRRLDAASAGQRAAIFVDGELAGRFAVVDANPARRWREIDVDLDPATGGGDELAFTVTAEDDFTAFRYELWANGDGEIFADGFESGGLDAWGAAEP